MIRQLTLKIDLHDKDNNFHALVTPSLKNQRQRNQRKTIKRHKTRHALVT